MEVKINCKWCGKSITKNIKEYNRATKKGRKHFYCGPSCWNSDTKRRYESITKTCQCGKSFTTKNNPKKEKRFCSIKCSNSFVRRGSNRLDKITHYSTICFLHHKRECVVCGEKNVVEVHHYDKNHKNNEPKNLVPLCPTHHAYMHTNNFGHLIENKIKLYIETILLGR
jgi:hypothetical protein